MKGKRDRWLARSKESWSIGTKSRYTRFVRSFFFIVNHCSFIKHIITNINIITNMELAVAMLS